MKKEDKGRKAGFSLVEIIVVISIMAVLGMVLAPQLVRHVNNNRITACKTDREAILAVYERCIYAQTRALSTGDLDQVLSDPATTTWDEVKQYKNCPSGGNFSGEVDGDVAIIHCNHPGHEDVVVDFVGWNGTELAEGGDDPLDPPPSSEEPETGEPETDPPTTTPEEGGSGYWPYEDDERWEGKRFPGQYVEVSVPSGLFTSKEGNTYVIIDRSGGTGVFPVYWEWNLGPENIDTRGWEHCIAWSGITIEDLSAFVHPNSPTQLTGIHYGDIVVYKGKRYIYGSHYGSELNAYQDYPVEGQNANNFYLVDPY